MNTKIASIIKKQLILFLVGGLGAHGLKAMWGNNRLTNFVVHQSPFHQAPFHHPPYHQAPFHQSPFEVVSPTQRPGTTIGYYTYGQNGVLKQKADDRDVNRRNLLDQLIKYEETIDEEIKNISLRELRKGAQELKQLTNEKIKMKEDLEERINTLTNLYEEAIRVIRSNYRYVLLIPCAALGSTTCVIKVLACVPTVFTGIYAVVGISCSFFSRYTKYKYRQICKELNCEPDSSLFA